MTDQVTWSSLFPPPDALCGIGGCTFTPHPRDTPHTWDPTWDGS